jgi:hypothetical protein
VARIPTTPLRPAVAFGREAALVAFAVLVYFGVRGLTEGQVHKAFANARELLRIEEALGVAWELRLQPVVVAHGVLLTFANWVYVYGHWPVIAACGVLLYLHRHDRYLLLRNAMIISGLIGFVFFAAVPVAPPRMVVPGIVDTVTEYSSGYRALQPPALTNQYAAMPSLHAGWNILLGIILFRTTRNLAVRAFAVVMPAAMALAVVVTGNHYVLDVIVGVVLVLVGLAVAHRLRPKGATLGAGEPPSRSSAQVGGSPVRDRAVRDRTPLGELDHGAEGGRGDGGPDDRGGRAPLSGEARGSPPQDDRPDSDSLG